MALDWGDGDYARTAAVLAPAAEALASAAGVAPGDVVVDVACGTGSAALAAARRGGQVTGVDAAERLLAHAAEAAARAGVDARFVAGTLDALPLPDASADVVVSSFGVIFADDPARALAEMTRVARPGGVVALTAWEPHGAVSEAGRLLSTALSGPGQGPGRWGDGDWLRAALAGAGAPGAAIRRALLPMRAASPEEWLEEQERHHPFWRAARRRLGDGYAGVRAEMLGALRAGNEAPGAFLCRSPYLIARARRAAGPTPS